jgi:RHS repeat-associated protein
VTESLGFDGFGNVNSDTVTGINMPSPSASRVTTSNWGTTGQFLATQTDPSGATTTWTYGSAQSLAFGVPDSVKDANNLTTSWGYDAFGRESAESRPDGTSTIWAWSPCTSQCGWSNSVYQIAQTAYQSNGTVIRTDTNLHDSIDRITQSSGPTVTGATGIVQKLYNSSGLLAQQSIPFLSGAPAYQQTYTYDALKRPLTITRPISSTNTNLQSTTFAYSGRTRTVTDPYSHVTTTITDVNGKLRQTKDPIGYSVTRSYDAAGSLIGVTDSVGNTLLKNVTYQYGIRPFLVASTDADRGAWTYTVDSLGERTGWTDAKGQSFSETYDALSRPVTRTEPDLFTQWTWGSTPASNNVGQLIAECTSTTGTPTTGCGNSPLYSETRTFNTAGRLSKRAITQSGNPGNDSGGVFQFTLNYSPTTGQLSTLTYPTSTAGVALNLQYGYQYGILQSVTDTTDTASTCGSTCVLWTANAMNGFGQITQETLGNGVVTNRNYDGVTSWLTSVTAGVGGGAALLNQSYLQDEDGDVIQRQNNNLGLTENFAYDADNRLTCITLTGSSCSTPTLVYDGGSAGPGNITSQAGVGTYTYPAAGQPRPHAVTSITGTFNGIANPAFSYDANGNMTARASSAQNITWSSYNYPTAIAASDVTGNEQVQLFYGPDRQRWKQIYTNSTTTEQTYYIGGLVDLVFSGGTTNYRHYIYAGNEPVAVYSRTAAGVNTMSYMLEDHQGGASAIASSAGTADVNESFSAFGTRRNPTTWTGPPTTSDLNTIASLSRQGYTFQTALGQSMGLNHMNGRVEDAILGRFLSPDPHIPDPTNAQSYNRYSYVRNNPLTRVDPTGFKDCVPASTCPGELSYGGVPLCGCQ